MYYRRLLCLAAPYLNPKKTYSAKETSSRKGETNLEPRVNPFPVASRLISETITKKTNSEILSFFRKFFIFSNIFKIHIFFDSKIMKYYVLFFFSKLLDLFIRFFFGKNYFDSVLKKNFYFGNSILVFRTYQKNI